MDNETYIRFIKRILEKRDSGASVEAISWELEKLEMKLDADRYAACVKKHKEEMAKATKEEDIKTTFEEIGKTIGRLVDVKNAKYGDSFSKCGSVLRILYQDGITPEQYDDVLTVCRILDKLFRVATDKDALGESPYTDIAGYCILAVAKNIAERCVVTDEK
jgi:hypothetical protein